MTDCLELNFCRICRSCNIEEVCIPFIDTVRQLEVIIGIKINISPILPSKICNDCFNRIQDAFLLREQCLAREIQLSALILDDEFDNYEILDDDLVGTQPNEVTTQVNSGPFSTTSESQKGSLSSLSPENAQQFNFSTESEENDLLKILTDEPSPLDETSHQPSQSEDSQRSTDLSNDPILNQSPESVQESQPPTRGKVIVLPPIRKYKRDSQRPTIYEKKKLHSKPKIHPRVKHCCQCEFKHDDPKVTLEHFIENHLETRVTETYTTGSCRLCYTHFDKLGDLQRHAKGVKPPVEDFGILSLFSCELCSKMYSTKLSLKQHVKAMHTEPGYVCDLCGARYPLKGRLKTHVNTVHFDIKPFPCSVCGKSFRSKVNLKKHMNWHTGKRLFICEYCGKSFADQSDIKRHEVVHTRNYLYNCNFYGCAKGFSRRTQLIVHQFKCTFRDQIRTDSRK